MYRDEQTGIFAVPSIGMVQQLWMDIHQFEEAGVEHVLSYNNHAHVTYRYSTKKLNILLERLYWPSKKSSSL